MRWSPPAALPVTELTAPRQTAKWYGYQLIISDLASVGLVAAAYATSDCWGGCRGGEALGIVGLSGMELGPAIIHLAHGHVGAMAGSLGLRIILPLVVGFIASVAAPYRGDLSVWGSMPADSSAYTVPGIAMAGAWLAGAAIDDAFLSDQPRREIDLGPDDVKPDSWPLSRDH